MSYNIKYLNHCQPQIRQIMMAIAESPRTIVFHCYAGKDRTGIIAALLLGLAGVSYQAIAEDYAKSHNEIQHLIQEWRDYALQHERDLDALKRDAASNPDTMLHMLHYIDRNYGNVEQYLQACGLSDSHLQKLKSHLIESDS